MDKKEVRLTILASAILVGVPLPSAGSIPRLAVTGRFADEGRASDNTMVGRDLAKWAGRWNTDDGS